MGKANFLRTIINNVIVDYYSTCNNICDKSYIKDISYHIIVNKNITRIHKNTIFTLRNFYSLIHGIIYAIVRFTYPIRDLVLVSFNNIFTSIFAASIYYYELISFTCLRYDAFYGFFQTCCIVIINRYYG